MVLGQRNTKKGLDWKGEMKAAYCSSLQKLWPWGPFLADVQQGISIQKLPKMIVALFLSLMAIVQLASSSSYSHFDLANYPNPQGSAENHWHCHVDRPGYVCDPDSLLSKVERLELRELVSSFTGWTKMPNSDDLCARQGVQLGIALSHFPVKYSEESGGKTEASTRDERLDEVLEDSWEFFTCLNLAVKWNLLQLEANCSRFVLIQLSTFAHRNVICSNESVPLLVPEKLAVLAKEKMRLTRGEFLPALKAMIGNLRQLIVHRQEMLFGPIGIGIGQREGGKGTSPLLSWLALLFSLAAFLLALFTFINSYQNPTARLQAFTMRMKELMERERQQKEEEEAD